MFILHLSDTTLSGAPYRASQLLNKYTEHESRHIVWQAKIHDRVFPTDLVGSEMTKDQLQCWVNKADIIHYHSRYKRQQIFKVVEVPKKPSVIQIHSPRESEDFSEELSSGIPLAIIAQYHVRQWPEKTFVVPNCIDIHDDFHKPAPKPSKYVPVVGYSPSNANGRGWDDKSYGIIAHILKRMQLNGEAVYNFIYKKPWVEAMMRKNYSNFGIDEISTGSYHMSGLEFLSMGVPCICKIDSQTSDAIKQVTGCSELPFINADAHNIKSVLNNLKNMDATQMSKDARLWMETYWNPKHLTDQYIEIYRKL